MSEAVLAAEAVDLHAVLAQVQALRCAAVPPVDPVRLHYIEALARRMQVAPSAVQKVLLAKLADALKAAGCAAGAFVASARTEPIEALTATEPQRQPRAKTRALVETLPPAAPLSLLGQLNQHIEVASAPIDANGSVRATQGILANPHPQDLKSAVRFRETWALISAETQLDQAAIRAPENAGPLNAHKLALRTLALMRELSPDYLRRFMDHTESLLWLDRAYGQLKQPMRGVASKRSSAKGS